MIRFLIIILINLFLLPFSYGQKETSVPVYTSFSDFEKLLNKQNDTTYVINFWATFCKPCIEELPYFEKVNEQRRNEKVKVILVSLDFKNQLQSKVLPFLKKNQIRSDVVLLADSKVNDWIPKISNDWDGAIPVTYIYKNKKTLFINKAFRNYDELNHVFTTIN